MSAAAAGSQRPPSQRRQPPDKSISQIEKSVTHLLVATKQLLETLTKWSRKQAQEEEVSDVYVRLGYEFNLACRAFNSIGVETSDLGPVPDLLRSILEDTLSQPASPQALDNYLPRIRDIIINLLHGLKRKQAKLRSRSSKDSTSSSRSTDPARQGSTASLDSQATGLTRMLEHVPGEAPSSMRSGSRDGSMRSMDMQEFPVADAQFAPPEPSSITRRSLRRDNNRSMAPSDSGSSISSNAAPNMPVLPPYAEAEHSHSLSDNAFPHPPPPPPKQHDALTALQRNGDLERRASRRFSAYQIQKHLGASPNGVPVIPPAQNSPIPNRGRDVRESMNAVRSRTSYHHGRTKSNQRPENMSPNRSGTVRTASRISEESEPISETAQLRDIPAIVPPSSEKIVVDSPTAKTPEEFHRPVKPQAADQGAPVVAATLNGPISPLPQESAYFPPTESPAVPAEHEETNQDGTGVSTPITVEKKSRSNVTPPRSQFGELDSSPPAGKELTLFLQYKSKIKKFVLPEGYDELTIARLQLAFIEKFAWNTHNHGVDLPDIYVQDPVSGVRHELEDLSDVKDRSVLVLNVEVLDEVKKHFDDGIGGLRNTLEGVRSLLDGQGSVMQRVSDRQLETSKEVARMTTLPSRAVTRASTHLQSLPAHLKSEVSVSEVQNLRRDIAILRQTYSNLSSDFTATINDIKAKATKVKTVAAETALPSYEGSAGRAHVNAGKKTLSQDSEQLVNRVDDLTDLVEDIRKDVVTRGVRPAPQQLETVNKDITISLKELARMKEFLKREKPIWTKIWEQELSLVCAERDELTQQEDLMADLQSDIDDLTGTYKLVEEAMKQQTLQNGGSITGIRSTSRNLPIDRNVDPLKAKDGVLGEVRALQPNHENRLEAIERAEKLRQRELESRQGGEFQREVEKFVEEGKLKKTGGADEVERLRRVKDEKARRENWERAQQRQLDVDGKQPGSKATEPNTAEEHEHGASHESSQEGEAAFQDASEHTIAHEEPTPLSDLTHDGPPRLPEMHMHMHMDEPLRSETATTPTTSPTRTSWLPSIFSSP